MLSVLLITPPLTQPGAPYPAAPYLKGFLNTLGCRTAQADLGLDLLLRLFSEKGLEEVFEEAASLHEILSEDSRRILALRDEYLKTINPVVRFLRGEDSTLALQISRRSYLPEGSRLKNPLDCDWYFGSMGIRDKALHLATLYLEELGDFIRETACSDFGFSRYAENKALFANSFTLLDKELNKDDGLMDRLIAEILEKRLAESEPDLVGLTVPFPGCLLGALKCARHIRKFHPRIKTAMGGGYVSSELREIEDPRIFQYLDFIVLDDGEAPLKQIVRLMKGEIKSDRLKRTFIVSERGIEYIDDRETEDVSPADSGVPDYSGLRMNEYLSIVEIANPMRRLWGDGRWNKLTVAKGCYWGKCAFCDVNLSCVKDFKPVPTDILMERIEKIIERTGQTGFHFVDEAAPPQALKKLAVQLIRKNISITWWTNVRFEKSFSESLCRLLAASGCVAVAGGLECAHDRLLKKMNKGVSVSRAAKTLNNFKKAGIMAHAYLMYGFPTQTEQETVDALEIVRQFFLNGLLDSGFWHRFSLTAHSLIAANPEKYKITIVGPDKKGFAFNDLIHEDPEGTDHEAFAPGLSKAVYNYMHGVGMDYETGFWFDFETPEPIVSPRLIESVIKKTEKKRDYLDFASKKVVWLGGAPQMSFRRSKDDHETEKVELRFHDKKGSFKIKTDLETGRWLTELLSRTNIRRHSETTLRELADDYRRRLNSDFQLFSQSPAWKKLRNKSLLLL